MATLPALMLWGTVSGRMQAKPWRMMVLAVVVMAAASVFQLLVAAQPTLPPQAQEVVEKVKLFETAWIAVALAMAGALMGAAVAAQAARLHAAEVSRVDLATATAVVNLSRARKALAAARASASPPAIAQASLAIAQKQFAYAESVFRAVQAQRERLGLEPHPEP